MRFPFLTFSLLAILLFSGCGDRATLFVDNDSDSSIIVKVDGKRKLGVSSGSYAKCFVLYGDHKVTVERDNKVVFEEMKTFEPNRGGKTSWRHYLLDPDADTKYSVREYEYFADEKKASKSKSRRVKVLPRKHWIDIPSGATALTPMSVVVTSGDETSTKRLCVVPNQKTSISKARKSW